MNRDIGKTKASVSLVSDFPMSRDFPISDQRSSAQTAAKILVFSASSVPPRFKDFGFF
jgi:hypothetical protein